jgi:O-antigen/teichoic acid export membrane protein
MNFFIYLINEGLSKVVPFITILVVAKFIDVELFGQLTLYYIILEVLTILVANNIRATTRIDYFRYSKEKYVTTKSAHIIGSFLVLIFILFTCLFINVLEFKYMFLLALIAFMRGLVYFVLSDLQCKENVKLYGAYNVISIVLSNLLFLLAILYGYSIEAWFYSIFIGTSVQFVFIIKYIKNNKLFEVSNIHNFKDIYNEFKHGLIFMPQAIGFWVSGAVDRVLISNILGNIIVGYYMFVFQLATPIIIFSTVVNLYLTPKINKFLKENKIKEIKSMLILFSFFILGFSIVNYIAIEVLINYFYYEKYVNSLEYVPFVTAALFFQAIYLIYMNIFYYIGEKKFISLLVLLLAFIKSFGVFIGLNAFGMYGLLYVNIFINIIVLIFVTIKLNKSLKLYKEK